MLLTKGIEVEQYTGLRSGQVLPLSALISQNLPGFTVEPDQRNVEFITEVTTSYEELLRNSIDCRMKLRNFLLKQNQDWTVVPGSALSLPFEQNFIFSKPEDPYHQHIHEQHGLNIITTSVHYNIGIEDQEELIRIVNLMRMEAPLMLAMSACSPFYNGQIAGSQSHRWMSFPKVPNIIPFFESHKDFIEWTNRLVAEGQMFNVRHFWGAVRPNGPNRPSELNRLEVRICDLSTKWEVTLAMMAWIELRVQFFLKNPELKVPADDFNLVSLSDENESAAAIQGLTARFSDWIYQEETSVFEAIEKRLQENQSLAEELGIQKYLQPIDQILTYGNEASHLLEKALDGHTVEEIMEDWTEESLQEDLKVEAHCKAYQ